MDRTAPTLIVAAVVLAGCGSADPRVEAPVSLAAAVAATAEAGSGRTESVTVMEMHVGTWTTRSTGIHDYRNDRSEITYEAEGRQSRVIIVGGTSYSELDAAEAFEMAPGKRWIQNDPLTEARFEELNGDDCEDDTAAEDDEMRSCSEDVFLFEISSNESQDPGETFELLSEYGSPLNVIGQENVRGAPAMHVRTHVDFHRAAEAWYREQGWSRKNIERALNEVPPNPALVDVWVDGDGLVRRVRTSQSYEGPKRDEFPELPSGWGSYSSVTTTEYFDFGVAVAIQSPPDSEVIDGEEWLGDAMERARSLPLLLGPQMP